MGLFFYHFSIELSLGKWKPLKEKVLQVLPTTQLLKKIGIENFCVCHWNTTCLQMAIGLSLFVFLFGFFLRNGIFWYLRINQESGQEFEATLKDMLLLRMQEGPKY